MFSSKISLFILLIATILCCVETDLSAEIINNVNLKKEFKLAENNNGNSGVWNTTKEVSSDVWDGTKEVTSDVWDGTKEVTSDVWDGTKKVGSDVKGAFTSDTKPKTTNNPPKNVHSND